MKSYRGLFRIFLGSNSFLLLTAIYFSMSLSQLGRADPPNESSFLSVDTKITSKTARQEESVEATAIEHGSFIKKIEKWESCFFLPEGWNPAIHKENEDGTLILRFGSQAAAIFTVSTIQLVNFSHSDGGGYTDITGVPHTLIEEVLLEVTEKVARNLDLRPGEYKAILSNGLKESLASGETNVRLASQIRLFPNGYYFSAGKVSVVVNLDARKAELIDIVNQLTPEKPIVNITETDAISRISTDSSVIDGSLRTPGDAGIDFYQNPMYLRTIGTLGKDGVEYWDCDCVRVRLCYLFFAERTMRHISRVLIDAETGNVLVEN